MRYSEDVVRINETLRSDSTWRLMGPGARDTPGGDSFKRSKSGEKRGQNWGRGRSCVLVTAARFPWGRGAGKTQIRSVVSC